MEHLAIRYEELVTDPSRQLKKCLQLLNLSGDPDSLLAENNPRIANTLSYKQVSQGLYQSSIGRWRNYEWMFDDDWHRLANASGY
jgi:hypothetical protein